MAIGLFGVIECKPNFEVVCEQYPISDFNKFSQLVVRQGQVAYILKEGVLSEVYEAGTHALCTRNLPVIKEFLSFIGNGLSPFQNYVFFVNMLHHLQSSWRVDGITYTISQKEFDNRPITLGFSGNISISVKDPETLLKKLALQREVYMQYELLDELQSVTTQSIKRALIHTIRDSYMNIFDLDSYTDVLSDSVLIAAQPIYNDYGIAIESMTVTSIEKSSDWENLKNIIHNRQDRLYTSITDNTVALIEASTSKQATIINAEAEAQATIINTNAQVEKTVLEANASASRTKIEAEATAVKIVTESKANAEQTVIGSQAEKERYDTLGTTYSGERAFNNSDKWAENVGTGGFSSMATGMAIIPTAAAIGSRCAEMLGESLKRKESPIFNQGFSSSSIYGSDGDDRNRATNLEERMIRIKECGELLAEGVITPEEYKQRVKKL